MKRLASDRGGAKPSPLRRLAASAVWSTSAAGALTLALGRWWPLRGPLRGRWDEGLALVAYFGRLAAAHLGVGLLLIALAALASRRRSLALLAGLGGALAASMVAPAWAPVAPRPPAGPTFRLMTMNLWSRNRRTAEILQEIRRHDPDVLLLQEYSKAQDEVLSQALTASMPVQFRYPAASSAGSALYSKLAVTLERPPLLGQERPDRNSSYLLSWQGRELVLHLVHFYSPRRAWRIVDTFEDAVALSDDRRPGIIAGDHNFTELSQAADALRHAGWIESFALAGQGPRATFPSKGWWRRLAPLRIDQVFLSPPLTATTSSVGAAMGSDHLPVVVDIAWAAP